jgi:hypothetical protein
MMPNCPLRMRAAIEPMSARSDSTERGIVYRIAGAAGATARRVVFFVVFFFVVFFFARD